MFVLSLCLCFQCVYVVARCQYQHASCLPFLWHFFLFVTHTHTHTHTITHSNKHTHERAHAHASIHGTHLRVFVALIWLVNLSDARCSVGKHYHVYFLAQLAGMLKFGTTRTFIFLHLRVWIILKLLSTFRLQNAGICCESLCKLMQQHNNSALHNFESTLHGKWRMSCLSLFRRICAQTCQQCQQNIQATTDAQRQLRDKEQQLAEERRLSFNAQQQLEDERHQRADENRRLNELLHETLEENRRLDAERLRFSDQCRRLEDRLQRSTSLATQHSSSRREADLLVKQCRLLEKARSSHHLITQVWGQTFLFEPYRVKENIKSKHTERAWAPSETILYWLWSFWRFVFWFWCTARVLFVHIFVTWTMSPSPCHESYFGCGRESTYRKIAI